MTTPQGAGAPSPTQRGAGAAPSGGGNVFTRKLGPLPMWAWMGVGLGVALALTSWRKNKAAGDAAQQAASDTTPAADVPPFIIQNFPSQPGPAGAPGAPGPPAAKPPVTTPKPTPAPHKPFYFTAYKTKSGDTLKSIAKKHHLDSPMDIFEASVQAQAQKPSSALKKALDEMEKHGTTGRLPAGITIYLPQKGHEQ